MAVVGGLSTLLRLRPDVCPAWVFVTVYLHKLLSMPWPQGRLGLSDAALKSKQPFRVTVALTSPWEASKGNVMRLAWFVLN